MNKKINLRNLILILPATFLLISATNNNFEEGELFCDEKVFNNLNYFRIFDEISSIKKASNYYETKYKFEFSTINTNYYLLFTYLNNENNEVIYNKEININDYITANNRIYQFDIKIPLKSLNNNIKFNLSINIPLFHYKFNISYYLTNSFNKIKLNTEDENRIYVKHELTNNSSKNYYFVFDLSNFVKNTKDIFYYDKFYFSSRYIKASYKNLTNGYLYIKDPINYYLNVSTALDILDITKRYIPLSFINEKDDQFLITYRNNLFYNPLTYKMYSVYNNNLLACEDAIYVPLKYYALYNKMYIGVEIVNYYNGLFNLFFEFEISFLNNFLKNEVGIIKNINQITNLDFLEDVYIWWTLYF